MSKCRFDYLDRCRNAEVPIWPDTIWMLLTYFKKRYNKHLNHTSCVIVSMSAFNVVHRRFKPWSAPNQRLKSVFLSFSRQESWKKGRPWLMYDNKKNVMKCSFSTSRNDNISSAFITGCNRFRIENIKNKIPWKVRFPYIRSIDINEAKTIKFRKTPAECVIQNLKLLLLQCIYIFFHLFIYVFFFSGF